MNRLSIKAVLFDYGGVLAEEGFRNGLLALATEQGLDVKAMPEAAMQAVYDSGFVVGQGSAADFWALLRERTGLQGEDEVLTRRILDGFVVRAWMLAIVADLRQQGYVTGILSDQTHWLDELDARDHFSEVFDHVFNSYYLGRGKHDPALFADVAARLDMQPGEILFVDDDAGNVERGAAAGFATIRYTDRPGFEASLARVLAG